MRWPALARRRQVLLPTWWGLLLLCTLGSAVLVFALARVHDFLTPQAPCGADLLVVEGWIEPEGLDQAVELVRAGRYARVVTAGGPIVGWADRFGFASFADLARDYLVGRGLPAGQVLAAPAPASAQKRTFLSAVEVRDRLQAEGLQVDAIDVFSSGCHARRTWLLYRMAFGPGVRVGILAARPEGYDPSAWWRSSDGAKAVLQELLSLAWTELFFWPGPRGSVDERWAVPGNGR